MTAPVALGRQIIAPLIPAFLKRYPDVQIQLDLSDRLAALATEGFDLAIRHVAEVPDTHVASLIGEIRSVLVATPRYLAEHGTPPCRRTWSGTTASTTCGARARRPGRSGVRGRTSACRYRSGQLRGQQQRGIARGGAGFRRHCAAARFQRGPALRDGTLVECWAIGGWRDFADSLFAVRPYTPHVPRVVSLFVGF